MKKHTGVIHSSVHRAYHRKKRLHWNAVLLGILILLVALATGNYFFDFRSMAAGAACQSMNRNQCTKNSSYCQWTPKPIKYKESKESCAYNDCVKGVAGCSWKTKPSGSRTCEGKKTIKKPVANSDGQCSVRAGLKTATLCKEKEVKGDKICKRHVWVQIQCKKLGKSYCQKSGQYDEFIQCGEYGQILMDTRCAIGTQECAPNRGCIPIKDTP